MDINDITLLGRAGRDGELKYTQNGLAILNFPLATEKRWKNKSGEWQGKTSWHQVSVMGQFAEKIAPSIRKGVQILVKGAYEQREWQTQEGEKKTAHQVSAHLIVPMATQTPEPNSTFVGDDNARDDLF